MTGTQITAEVDFDAEGKQAGYLRVPQSVHRSAYGWIPVPITVIRNGAGPTLVISAGVLRGPAHSPEEEAGLAALTAAFDLPYGWVFTGGGERTSTARTAIGAANRKGFVNGMAELGGAGCVTADVLAQTERGLRRIMHALGMLPDYQPDAPRGTRAVNAKGSVYAYDAGLFEPRAAARARASSSAPTIGGRIWPAVWR